MSEQAKITCGDDCGHCKPARDGWYHIAPCGTPEPKIGLRRTTVLVTMLPVKHCPLTGRALGFDADGNPTVGPSYAELERKAQALDALEEMVIDGNAGEWFVMNYGRYRSDFVTLLEAAEELADALPDPADATTKD